jgi:PIN domain
MILPSIQLRPSVDVGEAISLLQERAANFRNEAQPVGWTNQGARRNAYVQEATHTEARLRSILSIKDAAALFDSSRHRDICSMVLGEQGFPMIAAEVESICHRLSTLALELDNARKHLADGARCIVLDTNFYIEHPEKIEDAGFHALLGSSGAVRLLIPMVVVDELDGLKRSGDLKRRWRAGYSLAVVDRVIEQPPSPGLLRVAQANPPRGAVTMQIVFDKPDHLRLPIADDEIVDRSAACQPYAGPITLVTYDTGQSQRARMARLDVLKLRNDLEATDGA